jgi:hypothetical protein
MPYKDPEKRKECSRKSAKKMNALFPDRKRQQRNESRNRRRLYAIWYGIKYRCYCKHNKDYKRYGGRGITVCAEWQNSYEAFETWALANGYQPDLCVDRINNDGNYEPGNCQWLTRGENVAKDRLNRD